VLKRSLGEGFHLIGQGNTGMKTEPPSVKFGCSRDGFEPSLPGARRPATLKISGASIEVALIVTSQLLLPIKLTANL
jgi:hypothetical protein